MTWSDTLYLLPEILIAAGACFLLVAPVSGFRSAGSSAKWSMLILLGLTAAAVVAASNFVVNIDQTRGFASMFALDAFSIFFKLLFIATIALILLVVMVTLSNRARDDALAWDRRTMPPPLTRPTTRATATTAMATVLSAGSAIQLLNRIAPKSLRRTAAQNTGREKKRNARKVIA